jgi:hypothetical protein
MRPRILVAGRIGQALSFLIQIIAEKPRNCIALRRNLNSAEAPMIRYLLAVGFIAVCLGAAVNTTIYAQNPSPEGALIEKLKNSIIKTVGAQEKTVEVMISGNILTVARINSNLNGSSHGARSNEAKAVASVVIKGISDRPDLKNLHTIRVQYLTRPGSASKGNVLDTVDFRKDPNGVFQFHET